MKTHEPHPGPPKAAPAAFAVLVLAALAAACSAPPREGLLLRDVALIDPEAGTVETGRSIRIEGRRIVAVGRVGELGPAAEVIAGNGRYALPGLIDAHVHVDHPDELTLYPAYGVTSAIVLRGVPHHLRWREEIRSGERFGPGLYLTGDYLDGDPSYMEPMTSLDGVDAAQAAARRQIAQGYDFLKVFTRLAPEQLTAIGDVARQTGVCVVGHGGQNYKLEHLLAAGQANLAHGQDLIRWYLDGIDDEEGIERIVSSIADSDLTVTPNLAFTDGLIRQGEDLDALLGTAEARRLHPAVLQPFRRPSNRYIRNAEEWVPEVKARFEVEKRITRELEAAGVTLLAGTDASTSGVFPGDSLLREIELLVEAGLTPAAAIRTATTNAGRFLKRCLGPEIRVGRLAPGYEADIILVDDNPLADVTALRKPAAVFLDGRFEDRAALDTRLGELEMDYAAWGGEVVALEQAIFAGEATAAREIFDRIRRERPGETPFSQYVPFFVGYGFLYGDDGFNQNPDRLAMALALYEMYAETYPDYQSAHYMLGLARRANGDRAGARRSLERALAIHPGYRNAREQLESLTAEGDPVEAPRP